METIADDHLSIWLHGGHLKKEIKSFIVAIQDKSLKINYIKAKIDKTETVNATTAKK